MLPFLFLMPPWPLAASAPPPPASAGAPLLSLDQTASVKLQLSGTSFRSRWFGFVELPMLPMHRRDLLRSGTLFQITIHLARSALQLKKNHVDKAPDFWSVQAKDRSPNKSFFGEEQLVLGFSSNHQQAGEEPTLVLEARFPLQSGLPPRVPPSKLA